MFAYVGSIQNLKDLKDPKDGVSIRKLNTFGVSVVGDLMLQPWDTMSLGTSLTTADLGSLCVASAILLINLEHPNRATHYPLYMGLCTGYFRVC